jgi:regulator of nucleoside diphosphate kinase
MGRKRSYITSVDLKRLREVLEAARDFHVEDGVYVRELENQLERAKVLEPEDAPKNLVMMNCRVRVRDLDTREVEVYMLVYPGDSSGHEGKVSIFAPVGVALLGRRTGDVVNVEVPAGLRRVRVEDVVKEAEAAGALRL